MHSEFEQPFMPAKSSQPQPTLECEVQLAGGAGGDAAVPSGAYR